MKEEIAAALKNKHFLLLWSSQFLSQVAVNVMTFLLILKTFSETGSTIASSMVWVVFILPAIFCSRTCDTWLFIYSFELFFPVIWGGFGLFSFKSVLCASRTSNFTDGCAGEIFGIC